MYRFCCFFFTVSLMESCAVPALLMYWPQYNFQDDDEYDDDDYNYKGGGR